MKNAKQIMQTCEDKGKVRNCKRRKVKLYGICEDESDDEFEQKDCMKTSCRKEVEGSQLVEVATSSSSSDSDSSSSSSIPAPKARTRRKSCAISRSSR